MFHLEYVTSAEPALRKRCAAQRRRTSAADRERWTEEKLGNVCGEEGRRFRWGT
jgi:hypothetical protein